MHIETEKFLTVIAEKAQLLEGGEGVRSILLTMFRFPSLKNKKVSQKTGIAIPALAAVRGELVKAGIIEKKNYLGENGRTWISGKLNLKFEKDPLPNNFNSSLAEIPEEFAYLNKIEDFLINRPNPNFALDQSHATSSTVVNRTLYLLKKGEIEGRRIIFLGDDDATSLAVGCLDLAEGITVLDTDKNILNFLSESAKSLSIKNFKVIFHDLRDPCPTYILNQFDVVVMDPPYTNEGLRLFLKRAKQVLKTEIEIEGQKHDIVGKKCILCFGNKPPEELKEIQLSILDHGYIIKEMIPYFNIYKGASILGQFSHLYYLELSDPKSTEDTISLKSNPIYTSEIKKRKGIPFRPIGFHFIGEMHFNNQKQFLKNENLHKIFIDALNHADLIILDVYNHIYKPYGFSAVAILKTSHASIHTWPEHGYISIDIFICDKFSKGLKVIKFLKEKLQPTRYEFFYMERGIESNIEYKPINLGSEDT